jgi:hypothetical protein
VSCLFSSSRKHTLYIFSVYRIDLLKKQCSQWGLKSARGQAHTITSIGPAIEPVQARFPKQGSHVMRQTLIHEEKIIVSRCAVFLVIFLHYDVEVLPTESYFFAIWIFITRKIFKLARVGAWREVYSGSKKCLNVFGFSCNCFFMCHGVGIWLSYREVSERSAS